MTGIVEGQGLGANVIAPAPELHLLGPVPLGGLLLIETLQRPVVTFVESPMTGDREPGEVHLRQRQIGGADRPQEDRGMDYPEIEGFGRHVPAGFPGFLLALGGEIDIGPPGEAILEIPGRFPVTQEDEVRGTHYSGTSRTTESRVRRTDKCGLAEPQTLERVSRRHLSHVLASLLTVRQIATSDQRIEALDQPGCEPRPPEFRRAQLIAAEPQGADSTGS